MAVTNYYTVNGQIIGEGTAAGGYRPYGHDALGSVVATYDSTGSLENTYRNAPYGTQVEKTGTAADPCFLYNGGSGYRTTGRSYSPYYVRARHLDNETAQWTTVDALWPLQLPYLYAMASPATRTDLSGRVPSSEAEPCFKKLWEVKEVSTDFFKCLKKAGWEEGALKECVLDLPKGLRKQACGNIVGYMACVLGCKLTSNCGHPPLDPCTGSNQDGLACCGEKYYAGMMNCFCNYSTEIALGTCLERNRLNALNCGSTGEGFGG